MISKRTLMKWRKEALKNKKVYTTTTKYGEPVNLNHHLACINKILELTQELIDQHLLAEKSN